MALPNPIAISQTIAKAPVDQDLMDSIRLNLDYLDAQVSGGSFLFTFNANGDLRVIRDFRDAIDTAITFTDFTPNVCRAVLKKSGTGGQLRFDLRKTTKPKTPIIGIDHQYEGATQSIARIGSAISTQSIQRSVAQISTQSISRAKSQLSIQSIINVGTNLWRYNFSGALLDSDYVVGKSVLVAGATAGGNNGTFAIVSINQSGFPSIVVSNASGVAQTSAAGTVDLQLFSYNYSNPVDPDFAAGEIVLMATHTDALSNGSKEIYKTNQTGNNIWIFDATGVTQGGAAGTADTNRWIFAYSSAVNTAHYVAGETALTASHTSGGNNGNLRIADVNRAGNNLVLYNPIGVVQGGAAGTSSSNRWVYALSTDPSSQVTVGDLVSFENHTGPTNNLIAEVKIVNDSASNNLVIFNQGGVAQAGVAGSPRHTRKLVKFSSDQAANYTTDSFIQIQGAAVDAYNTTPYREHYKVLQVNRGGGSNFNVVIDGQDRANQASPAGYIVLEAKSIFTVPPVISNENTGDQQDQIIRFQTTNIVAGLVETTTPLVLYVLEVPFGTPEDLTVILA